MQRIVVCDDEIHIATAVSMKLSKAGFQVETCRDGQAGWESISREVPALVITDYQMPRMDGLELCRQIQTLPADARPTVFLLTAKGLELDAAQLKADLGVDRVLIKPFSPRDLLKEVESVLALAAV